MRNKRTEEQIDDYIYEDRKRNCPKQSPKIGKAYGFLDYEGRWTELAGQLEVAREMANFSDSLRLMVLDDRLSMSDMDNRVRGMYNCKRPKIPKKIVDLAESSDVYGSVPLSLLNETFTRLTKDPVKATSLRYLVMAQDSRPYDTSDSPGQGRANQHTAGELSQVFSLVGQGERSIGGSDIARYGVFYMDGRWKAQRFT